jgi:NAD(P)-dependent dehydrogenase (short-subunit alcohol dehydrogenase family)
MTTALARELAPYKINVNAICPGLAASEMHWSFMRAEAAARKITFEELRDEEFRTIPLGRYAEGRDSAGVILWLASESGSYITGQLINVNGGLYFA